MKSRYRQLDHIVKMELQNFLAWLRWDKHLKLVITSRGEVTHNISTTELAELVNEYLREDSV